MTTADIVKEWGFLDHIPVTNEQKYVADKVTRTGDVSIDTAVATVHRFDNGELDSKGYERVSSSLYDLIKNGNDDPSFNVAVTTAVDVVERSEIEKKRGLAMNRNADSRVSGLKQENVTVPRGNTFECGLITILSPLMFLPGVIAGITVFGSVLMTLSMIIANILIIAGAFAVTGVSDSRKSGKVVESARDGIDKAISKAYSDPALMGNSRFLELPEYTKFEEAYKNTEGSRDVVDANLAIDSWNNFVSAMRNNIIYDLKEVES